MPDVPNDRIKVLACATVLEELLPIMPPNLAYEVFDFGLHVHPETLRAELQGAVDRAGDDFDVVLLGYGLCSMAVVGLHATSCTLVIPRVDDCIACFLGSQAEYRTQAKEEPGTYYLTKGWIEVGDTLLDEYERIVSSYGAERAERIMGAMLKHYRRLVYIDTGHHDQQPYRQLAQSIAERFGLAYEEIPGSRRLLHKLVFGPWDDEFVVAQPGSTVDYLDFRGEVPITVNSAGTRRGR